MRTLLAFLSIVAVARSDGDSGYSYTGSYEPHGAGEPVIQKHIYVHVPPPDPEFHAPPPKVIAPPPPKKHYKIVFIKAPTYSPPQAPVIPELQQHQEKTLIYVLHKNPSDMPPIVIPTAKPTQPSKPEVYFIRYKTQKEVGYAGSPTPGPEGYLPSSTVGGHDGVFLSSTARPSFHRPTPVSILPRSPTPKYATPSPSPHH